MTTLLPCLQNKHQFKTSCKSVAIVLNTRSIEQCSKKVFRRFGLEGTFKGPLLQPLRPGFIWDRVNFLSGSNEQRHLQLYQVSQSLVQPDFKCFQGWGICKLSRQLVAVFHHRHHAKFLPYIWSVSTFF